MSTESYITEKVIWSRMCRKVSLLEGMCHELNKDISECKGSDWTHYLESMRQVASAAWLASRFLQTSMEQEARKWPEEEK